MISLHGLNLRIGFEFWNLKQESTIEVSKMGSHLPCWKKIAGIGFLIIILKNLISGFGDILVSFSSGSLVCLLTFISHSQVKSLTEVHPITLIFLRSVTTLAIITPVCTPSIYETEPNNTLYSNRFFMNFMRMFLCWSPPWYYQVDQPCPDWNRSRPAPFPSGTIFARFHR